MILSRSPICPREGSGTTTIPNKLWSLKAVADLAMSWLGPVVAIFGGAVASGIHPSRGSSVLLDGDNDLLQVYAFADIVRGPFLLSSDEFGFPNGTNFQLQYVESDSITTLLWVLRLLLRDPILAVNCYILLSFALAFLCFKWMCSRLVSNPWLLTVLSLVFSWLPSTLIRLSYGHVFLASTWMIPLALGLILRSVALAPGQTRERLVLLLGGLVVGLGTPYFAFFSFCFALLMFLQQLFSERRGVRCTDKTLLGLTGTLVLPSVVKVALSGLFIDERIVRSASSSLAYPGRLHQFFSPIGFPYLAPDELSSAEPEWFPVPALVTVGILVALGRTNLKPNLDRFLRFGILLGIAIFVYSGLGFMFAVVLSPALRAWTRIGPFVAALALIVLGVALERFFAAGGRTIRKLLLGTFLIVSCALQVVDGRRLIGASFDAVAAGSFQEPYERALEQLRITCGDGCPVLMLPFMELPEGGSVGDVGNGDHLMPGILSSEFQWSYGAMKGTRYDDWLESVRSSDYTQLAAEARHAGFRVIWVDTRAGDSINFMSIQDWRRNGASVLGKFGPHVLLDIGEPVLPS